MLRVSGEECLMELSDVVIVAHWWPSFFINFLAIDRF
jgi:hypothetical protein